MKCRDDHDDHHHQDEEEERQAKALQTLLEDFSNPDIADSLEKAFRHLGKHVEGEQLVQETMKAAQIAEVGKKTP